MVAVTEHATAKGAVPVTLTAGEAASGLADMIGQYLTEILEDSPEKRAEAGALRGRLGLRAEDGDVAVTIVFGDDGIHVEEGFCEPDAVVSGPVETLMHTLAGRVNPACEVCSGALTVIPGTHPLFGYQAYRLMRLPGVHIWSGLPRPPAHFVLGAMAATGLIVVAWRIRKVRARS